MSFRGFSKAISRLPHLLLQKTGRVQQTKDQEFITIIQTFNKSLSTIEKLISDILKYNDSLHSFLQHQRSLIECLTRIAQATDASDAKAVQRRLLDNLTTITTEIDSFLDGRIIKTLEELLGFGKAIATLSKKRSHKLLDYDRYLYDVKELEQIPSRSISEERKLTKKTNLLLLAKDQYDLYNTALKTDLPAFHSLQSSILSPLMDLLIRFQQRLFSLQAECIQSSMASSFEYGDILKEYISSVEPVFKKHQELPLVLYLMGKGGLPDLSGSGASSIRSGYSSTLTMETPTPTSSTPTKEDIPLQRIPQNSSICVAEYDFSSPSTGDLSFKKGDRIEIVEKNDSQDSWWKGRNVTRGNGGGDGGGEALLFPANYVRLL